MSVCHAFENEHGQAVVDLRLGEAREIYLTIGGEKAFQTGYRICDTCRYVFSKLMPAQRLTDGTTDAFTQRLSASLRDVDAMPNESELREFASVLAPGPYSVVLASLAPRLVMPGGVGDYFANEAIETWDVDPYFGVGHSPKTPYYRLGESDLGPVEYGGDRLGIVLAVPLFPPTQRLMNNPTTIGQYRDLIRRGATRPTVLALGLADDRGPATWPTPGPKFSRHLISTLYVLDGHHKLAAAAQERLPIQFLAFFPHRYVEAGWTKPISAGIELIERIALASTASS